MLPESVWRVYTLIINIFLSNFTNLQQSTKLVQYTPETVIHPQTWAPKLLMPPPLLPYCHSFEPVFETSTTDVISSIIISDMNSSNVTTDEVDPPSGPPCSPTPFSGRADRSKSKDIVRVFRLSSCFAFLSPLLLPLKRDSNARGAAVAMRLTGLRMLVCLLIRTSTGFEAVYWRLGESWCLVDVFSNAIFHWNRNERREWGFDERAIKSIKRTCTIRTIAVNSGFRTTFIRDPPLRWHQEQNSAHLSHCLTQTRQRHTTGRGGQV